MFAGSDFNRETGYVRRPDGFRRTHGMFRFSPRPASAPSIRKLTYQANLEYFTDPSGRHVKSREQRGLFRIELASGDTMQLEATRSFEAVDEPFTIAKGVRVPAGGTHSSSSRAATRLAPSGG